MAIQSLLTFCLLLLLQISNAQQNFEFTTGLSIGNSHHYGREAIVTDQLAFRMANGNMERPHPEGRFFTSDENNDVLWQKIDVDSTGKFRGPSLANGYIYLTYQSDNSGQAILNVTGNSMCYFNGEPRGGDIYSDGWMNIPVTLKKGLNEIFIRCTNFSRWQGVKAQLSFSKKPAMISTDDAILPHIVIGKPEGKLTGAIVITNNSGKVLKGLSLTSNLNGKTSVATVADLAAATTRKVAFTFDPAGVLSKGDHACDIQLMQHGRLLDKKSLTINAVDAREHQSHTFISDIDGSVQYYSVAPSQGAARPALFLSVHGAGVQAIGQARAYQPKDWGVLVAPTNRRPRGFNWEDWGRIDALEVLELAKKQFQPDPSRIYLTGHSMGGHGTWFLGATYPDKWAAIAPCAGYPTLTGYGSADGRIPDSARAPLEQILLRASNGSNVIALARNYSHHGVYVFHGDADRTVPVTFARQMRDLLGNFHPDFSYYEYPGGSHWFGNESVDWPPLFEYFRMHTLKPDSAVNSIHFITANPGVSASFRWASILQQQAPLEFSKFDLSRDIHANTISGSTENVAALKLDLADFNKGSNVTITLDSASFSYEVKGESELYFTRNHIGWAMGTRPVARHKNPHRSGTFKEAFNHRMVFVYGTAGNANEDLWTFNKARYDAEVWYYRGNGSVELIADNNFDPSKYPDRGIILYGNSATNSAWRKLLNDCPIQVTRDHIAIGSEKFRGDDLAAYFTWPRHDSDVASVGVISGTGLRGWKAAEPNQYFAAGSGFPDYLIFSLEMLNSGADGIKATGFFDNTWSYPNK